MLRKQGLLAISLLIVIFLVLHFGLAGDGLDTQIAGPLAMGGTAYILMSTSMILSTRARFLEDWFGGLDRMYQVHKMSGVLAIVLVFVHFLTAPKDLPKGVALPAGVQNLNEVFTPSAPMGMFAMVSLVLLLFISLNRKIPYSKWRPVHKLMGISYILASLHFILLNDVFRGSFGPSIPFLMLLGLIGILSFLYSIFGLNKRNAVEYRIDEVNSLERATEIVMSPIDEKVPYKAGQFAFVEIEGKGWNELHPFTISSNPEDDNLRFVVKVLGDWTRKVRDELKPGGKVLVRGPYGRFNTKTGAKKQVWIAGGVGLTPFLSSLRDMKPDDDREIHLIYAAREKDDAIFLDELNKRAKKLPNVTVKPLYSNDGEFAQVSGLKKQLSDELKNYEYFMCGPKPMTSAIMKDLKKEGVERSSIHTEAFEFR